MTYEGVDQSLKIDSPALVCFVVMGNLLKTTNLRSYFTICNQKAFIINRVEHYLFELLVISSKDLWSHHCENEPYLDCRTVEGRRFVKGDFLSRLTCRVRVGLCQESAELRLMQACEHRGPCLIHLFCSFLYRPPIFLHSSLQTVSRDYFFFKCRQSL